MGDLIDVTLVPADSTSGVTSRDIVTALGALHLQIEEWARGPVHDYCQSCDNLSQKVTVTV